MTGGGRGEIAAGYRRARFDPEIEAGGAGAVAGGEGRQPKHRGAGEK